MSFTPTARISAAVADVLAFYDPDCARTNTAAPASLSSTAASKHSSKSASAAAALPALPPALTLAHLVSLRALPASAPLPMSLLQPLSAGLLFISRVAPQRNSQFTSNTGARGAAVAGYVHELVRGSSIAPVTNPDAPPVYSPAVAANLERIRAKVAKREINLLLGKRADGTSGKEDGIFGGFSHVTKDLSIAANIIMMMVTGFVVMWYVGRMLYQHNTALQMGFGAVGVVGVLAIETVLLAIRDNKQERWEKEQAVKRARGEGAVTRDDIATAMASAGLDSKAWRAEKRQEERARALGGGLEGVVEREAARGVKPIGVSNINSSAKKIAAPAAVAAPVVTPAKKAD